MSGHIRDNLKQEEIEKHVVHVKCPKCGNSSQRKNEDGYKGITYWWYEVNVRTVRGEFNGTTVVEDDAENGDFDKNVLVPGKLDHGLYCEQCRHEWPLPGDEMMDEYDVKVKLELKATEARFVREGWEKITVKGDDVATGDMLELGTAYMRVQKIELASHGKSVLCSGPAGLIPVPLDKDIEVYRQRAKTVVGEEVARFVTSSHGPSQNRFTLEGLRVSLEPHFDKRSVFDFLDAWTKGTPATECWGLLKSKKSSEPEETKP